MLFIFNTSIILSTKMVMWIWFCIGFLMVDRLAVSKGGNANKDARKAEIQYVSYGPSLEAYFILYCKVSHFNLSFMFCIFSLPRIKLTFCKCQLLMVLQSEVLIPSLTTCEYQYVLLVFWSLHECHLNW